MIPDYISPIVGYRVWTWDTSGLKSLCGERWHPNQSLAARCRASAILGRGKATNDVHDAPYAHCTCGIYAAKTLHHFGGAGCEQYGIHGDVYLWGKVVEHERGWRAQLAYPKNLFLSPDGLPFTLAEIRPRVQALTLYGSDIFVLGNGETIPLWSRSSGFHPAGLDYLTEISKESYVRRKRNGILKRGARVAVLGRGVAVVEHVNNGWIQAVILNKCTLRITRKHISWDDRNQRWETSPHACVEMSGKA